MKINRREFNAAVAAIGVVTSLAVAKEEPKFVKTGQHYLPPNTELYFRLHERAFILVSAKHSALHVSELIGPDQQKSLDIFDETQNLHRRVEVDCRNPLKTYLIIDNNLVTSKHPDILEKMQYFSEDCVLAWTVEVVLVFIVIDSCLYLDENNLTEPSTRVVCGQKVG